MKDGFQRLLLLSNTFLPHAGGSRVMYFNLFKRLAATGDEVTVVTTKIPGWEAFDAAEQTPEFRVVRKFEPAIDHSWSQLPKMLGPAWVALTAAVSHRPDVLHCGDLFPIGLVSVLLKKVLRMPLVVYCHGENITQTDHRRFQPRLRNLVYSSADAVVANSDFTVAHLERIGVDAKRIHKITPGLDATVFFPEPPDPELRSKYGIADELVVMTIARLDPRKGHDRVLHALAALKDCVPPFKYVIVGKGERDAELRKLTADLQLQDKVVFAGFVSTQDLNHYYNMADIMAMPNVDLDGNVEGFGMVFLEANAAGKPVIGGRSGGTIEAVVECETGFLVDPGNEGELVEALRKLLTDDGLRKRMGDQGLQRVRREFDWDSRAGALRRINAEVAKASPGALGRDRMAASGDR